MALTASLRRSFLDAVLRGTAFPEPAQVWLSAHTADPGNTGASEMAGSGYARVQIRGAAGVGDMTAAAGDPAASSNGTDKVFPANSGGASYTITHLGLWDASAGGNFIGGADMIPDRVVPVGVALRILAGDLDVTGT